MSKYERNPNSNCLNCSKAVYKRPSQIKKNNGKVFCTIECYGFFNRKEKPCKICGTLILASANKKTCSRVCSNISRKGLKYKRLGPKKDKVKAYRMLKLRLLKLRGRECEMCGYNKYEILQVHHRDRNRLNNELENLALICPNCHFEEHYLEKSWLRK